jgi:homoserine O-succinyltransferase
MVVNMDAGPSGIDRSARHARPLRDKDRAQREAQAGECLTIGLLNNMAGAAFKNTERQFLSLLDSASAGIPVHVSFYTLPGLSLTESGGQQFARHYEGVDSLLNTQLDGLIVTGREPKLASLRDEPYWQSFTQVLEWARNNTCSAIWSCLAAHAAVQHMDGIDRLRSEEKNFGVFACEQASDHPLAQGLTPHFHVPHSRWNGVAREDLLAQGYDILSSIANDGVDTFIRQEKSLFVFFQGHPEYESDTLMREYRRDLARFLKGETSTYPLLPAGYFDRDTESVLTALRSESGASCNAQLLLKVASVVENAPVTNTWQHSATTIYRNWLNEIRTRKNAHGADSRSVDSLAISK